MKVWICPGFSNLLKVLPYNFSQRLVLNPFYEEVYALVSQIPYGKVVSYGQIAWMLGRPHGAREVGRAMRLCPEYLPYQRVVMADGSITGGMSADIRKALLDAEGVTFLSDGRVDMKSCRWSG